MFLHIKQLLNQSSRPFRSNKFVERTFSFYHYIIICFFSWNPFVKSRIKARGLERFKCVIFIQERKPLATSPSDPMATNAKNHHRKRAEGEILPCRLPSSPIVTHRAPVDSRETPRGSWIPRTHPVWRWCGLHLGNRRLQQKRRNLQKICNTIQRSAIL